MLPNTFFFRILVSCAAIYSSISFYSFIVEYFVASHIVIDLQKVVLVITMLKISCHRDGLGIDQRGLHSLFWVDLHFKMSHIKKKKEREEKKAC